MKYIFSSIGRLWTSFWLRILRKFVDVSSNDAELHHEVGEVHENEGQLELALRCFSKSVNLAPHQARHRSARSRVYFKCGQLDQALVDADGALDLDSEDHLALYLKGICLEGMGRGKEASQCLDQAISLSPDDLTYREARNELRNRQENEERE